MSLSEFSTHCTDDTGTAQLPVTAEHRGLSCAELMLEIKSVFGRATPRLAAIFNVSRETLLAWLAGELPPEQYRTHLQALALAARTFLAHEFKPTTAVLDLTLIRGKSFLSLISEGADGAEMAERLMKIVQRNTLASARLDAVLSGKTPEPLSARDFGAEAFDETLR